MMQRPWWSLSSSFYLCCFYLVYQKKNFDLVLKTLQNIPRTSEMATKSRGELKKMIDRLDRLAHPLLQW